MTYLVLYSPLKCEVERGYACDVILNHFLGQDVRLVMKESAEWSLTDPQGLRRLIMPDSFFRRAASAWLNPASLPDLPLPIWRAADDLPEATLVAPHIPVIAGELDTEGRWFVQEDGHANGSTLIRLGLDVLGAAFFMLTRYEEVVVNERDAHDRFPACASLAYREGFLDRPIVNEYTEILWAAMKRLWPGLQRKTRLFKMFPTHDVDHPYAVNGLPTTSVVRACLGDLLKRKNMTLAAKRWQSWVNVKKYGADQDINNTYDYLMDKSEAKSLKSAFYFMASCLNKKYDSNYSLQDPWIRQLLQRIHHRGHEIGLHPSYDTFQDPQKTSEELQFLQKICQDENIQQEKWGGRQHFLRWEAPATWRNWDIAGLDYDSTLGFADRSGFRCGTCYDFRVYDIQERRQLKLRERPLIVMEGTLLGENYLGLDHDLAWTQIRRLIAACQLFSGEFVLLWHNSHLLANEDFILYEKVLNYA